ncbi:MAG: ABC transporter substrate-binding protein [Rickettsiales bacterium]|nr:ABC transporter substrate-binding protein [Rickettsiales bacterium]
MTKMFKKRYFRILFFAVILTMVFTPAVSLLSFAGEEGVKSFVDKVAQNLIDAVKHPNTSLKNKRIKVKAIVEESFDIAWMSRFALGVNYRKLSSNQKGEYESLYLDYLVGNYFPILIKYDSDDSYEILKIQSIDKQDYDVRIRLTTNESQNPVMLKYRIRRTNTGYKCLDMIVEGVSTLISQRAEFSSIVQRSGVQNLLQQLRAKRNRVDQKE